MNNLSEIKKIVYNYDNLRRRLVKIIEILDWWEIDIEDIRSIKFFNKDTKDNYENVCYNIADNYNCDIMEVLFHIEHTSYIPVDWLSLDESSLIDAATQERKRMKEAQEKIDQEENEFRNKMFEELELQEYERLKAKFEK